MIGWEKHVIEPVNGIFVAPATGGIKTGWVTLDRWTKADAEALKLVGPSKLYGHIGWEFGATFPVDVKIRWLRETSDDGATQMVGLTIGTTKIGADGHEGPEYLSIEDFPLAFQVRQEAGIVTLRKVITVIDSPDSRIASRIAP